MSSISLLLDKLRVTSLAEDLEVSVSSSVSLVCSDEAIRILEPSQLLTLLRSGTVWVTRGNGCRLEFTILFNGQKCDQQSQETVIQNLSYYLQDTPLWSQISLDAKVQFPQSDGSNRSRPDFTIGLRHSFSSKSSLHSRSLQLPAAADIKAPITISCLQLKTVEICMNFKSSKASLTKTLRDSECLRGSQLLFDSGGFPEKGFSPLDEHSSSDGLIPHPSSLNVPEECVEDEEILNDEILSVQGDRLFSLPVSQSSTASSLALQPMHECERECNDRTGLAILDSRSTTGIHRMAEYALRTLIGGRQTKGHPEFKVLKPHSGQALSQIAPAMWSPGFLDAVSERSRFVPTISRVFSNTCLSNALSPSLRRKLANVISKEMILPHTLAAKGGVGQGLKGDDLEGHETRDSVDDIVQGRIWRMMQLSIYDPLAARRLRPPQNANAQHVEAMSEGPRIDSAHGRSFTLGQSELLADDFFSFLEDEFDDLFDNTLEENGGPGDGVNNDFEDLFDDFGSEVFEDLLNVRASDGIQSELAHPCDMDRQDEDIIEKGDPTESWDEALKMNGNETQEDLEFVAYVDEEIGTENQSMLL